MTSTVYRKSTYPGLMLNFAAVCSLKWKLGFIHCLLHRAYAVCSTWKVFHEEVTFLKNIFLKYGYPEGVFKVKKKGKPPQSRRMGGDDISDPICWT